MNIASLLLLTLTPAPQQSACFDISEGVLAHPPAFFEDSTLVRDVVHRSDGDAFAFVIDDTGSTSDLYAIQYDAGSATWLAPELIVSGLEEIGPTHQPVRADVAPDDTVHLAVVETEALNFLRVRSIAPGGTWSAPVTLDSHDWTFPGQKRVGVDIAVHANGDVLVAWGADTATAPEIHAVVRDAAAGTWGPPIAVSPVDMKPDHPTFALSPDRTRAHLFFNSTTLPGDTSIHHTMYDAVGKTFGASSPVPGSDDHVGSSLNDLHLAAAADNAGGAACFWSEPSPGTLLHDIHGAYFDGATWQSEVVYGSTFLYFDPAVAEQHLDVTANGEYLFLALVASGDAAATRLAVPIHRRPGLGFFSEEPVLSMQGGAWAGALRAYDGERALAFTDVSGEPYAVAYNGAEWSAAPFEVEQSDWTFELSSGPSGILLLNQWSVFGDSQVRATWIEGASATVALPGEIAGGSGAPGLMGPCDLATGQPAPFLLSDAAEGAPAILAAGHDRIDLPLYGGALVPSPLVAIPAITDATGAIDMTLPWPGMPSGDTLYAQWWILDAGAEFGVAASNGIATTQP